MRKKLAFLISEGEGYDLEFKEDFSDSIAREMCAFANANGGRILLGVSDDKKVIGLKITNRLKSQVQDLARNMDPKLEVKLEQAGNVLMIHVPEGKSKPYSVNGRFYMRNGPNPQQLTRDEIRDFFYSEGLIRFDEKPNARFDLDKDLNNKAYEEFILRAGVSRLVKKSDLFENLELLEQDRMRNAGVLLFCNSITRFFPAATITCIVFQGTQRLKIIDRKEFTADLLGNFLNALDYLKQKLNTEYIIRGGGPRDEKLELPEEALREALLNAIAHRDYLSTGAIFVEIYSDRVRIENPGGLVKGLDLRDLGGVSRPRNMLLFGLMQRMDLVEKAGSGILRMREAMKAYKLPPMKIEVSGDSFSVTFLKPKSSYEERVYGTTTQNTTQNTTQKIINMIRMNPKITRRELAETLGITEDGIKFYLARMKKQGLLKRVGPDRGGYWEVLQKEDSK